MALINCSFSSALGVGMATSGPRLGMQYVDPTPIATHTVSPEAMEGMNQTRLLSLIFVLTENNPKELFNL